MAYKPKVVAGGGNFVRGKGQVALSGDKTKVRVIMQVDDKERTYVLKVEDCPKYVQSGSFSVSLTEDGKKMYSMYPVTGMFSGKVSKFVAPDGQDPSPKTDEKYGNQFFSILVEITDPAPAKGMIVPVRLSYNFAPVMETIQGKEVEVVGISHPKSKYTPLLVDFCDAVGLWDKGPMKYTANVLPTMQKRIFANDRKFNFVLRDGWVNTIFTMDQPLTETPVKKEKATIPDEPESRLDDDFDKDVKEQEEDEIPWS